MIRSELGALLSGNGNGTLRLTVAKVVSVASGRVTLTFGGTNVANVPYLSHFTPAAGQLVAVLSTGSQHLIIGRPA